MNAHQDANQLGESARLALWRSVLRLPVLKPDRWMRYAGLAVAGLLLLHAFRYVYLFHTSHPYAYELVDRMGLDNERGLGTWLATMLLMVASLLAFSVAKLTTLNGSSDSASKCGAGVWAYRSWLGVGLALLLASIDEACSFHEMVGKGVDRWVPTEVTEGYLLFAWVLVGFPVAGLMLLVAVPALRSMPGRLRVRLILSGVLFCGGALGMELIGGEAFSAGGLQGWRYNLSVAVEEGMELLGVSWAVTTLMAHLQHLAGERPVLADAGVAVGSSVAARA